MRALGVTVMNGNGTHNDVVDNNGSAVYEPHDQNVTWNSELGYSRLMSAMEEIEEEAANDIGAYGQQQRYPTCACGYCFYPYLDFQCSPTSAQTTSMDIPDTSGDIDAAVNAALTPAAADLAPSLRRKLGLDTDREKLVLGHSQNLLRAAHLWQSGRIIRLVMLRKRLALDVHDICQHPTHGATLAHLPMEVLEVILKEAKTSAFVYISENPWSSRSCRCPAAKRFDDIAFWARHPGFRKWLDDTKLDAINDAITSNKMPSFHDVTTSLACKAMYPSALDHIEHADGIKAWDVDIDNSATNSISDRQLDPHCTSTDANGIAQLYKARHSWAFDRHHVRQYYNSPEGRRAGLRALVTGGPGSEFLCCESDLCGQENMALLASLRRVSSEGPLMEWSIVHPQQSKSRYKSHVDRSRAVLRSVHTFLLDHNLIASAAKTAEDIDRCLHGAHREVETKSEPNPACYPMQGQCLVHHRECEMKYKPNAARYVSQEGPYLALQITGKHWQLYFEALNLSFYRSFGDHVRMVRDNLQGTQIVSWSAANTMYT